MWQELLRIIVYYRRWITAALVMIVVYNLALLIRPGTEVLMASATTVAGQRVSEFVPIRAADLPAGFMPIDMALVQKLVARVDITRGTVLSADLFAQHVSNNRVTVSLAIDTVDSAAFRSGSTVHIWAMSDAGAHLVSENAILISITTTAMSTLATLSVPVQDEFAVLQAQGIRLVAVT